MTLEVHLSGTHILVSLELLHGIEVAAGQLILIGDVEIPAAQFITHTESDAMGILPVHVVSRRSIGYTGRVELHITHAVLIVGRRLVVITGTQGQIGIGFELNTGLQQMNGLQGVLRIILHRAVHIRTLTVVIVRIV